MTLVEPAFRFVQDLVFDRVAIVLSDEKQYLVESRLLPVARRHGLTSVAEIVDRIRRTADESLERAVVEALTTNETSWFRDIHPFEALRETVLRELIERRSRTRRLGIWSAASSSGQELYSVAMLIEEHLPELRGWQLDLYGTDYSLRMVERGRAGWYSVLEVNRGLPVPLLVKHFTEDSRGYRISETLRRTVRFEQMNLVEPWPALPRFDVVLLRNVLIYFDEATRRRILDRVAAQLAPDGVVFLGSAENMLGMSDRFSSETAQGSTFYRLRAGR
jgi:chemotaxis protein methyltransferase CheR